MTDKVVAYFLARGIIRKEAERLALSFADAELFSAIVVAGALDHVADVRRFVKGLAFLKDNAYEKAEHGETMDELYIARHKLHQAVSTCLHERRHKQTAAHNGIPPPLAAPTKEEEQRRYEFAAWALWQRYKSKMYLSCNVVFGYCYRWKLDSKELFKHLHNHPTHKGIVTTCELHECERAIEAFLRKATAIGIKAPVTPKLDEAQNAAIQRTLRSGFSAIQGTAGCGKTTSVSHMVNAVCNQANVVCVAFTHKAKRCIKQKINNEAVQVSTIHSFNQSNRNNPNLGRLFLVDETSMLDVELLAELAKTVTSKCNSYQLCFVGDEQQLPPIGRGEFFRQLVKRGGTAVNVLSRCYRTDRPDLFAAFQDVREGRMPQPSENCNIVYVPHDGDASGKAINAKVGAMISNGVADPDNVQFIAWQNKDVFKINKWVQERKLRMGRVGPEQAKGFYKGDRVIYKGDNNKDGLTNSTVGYVQEVAVDTGALTVKWEDDAVTTFAKDVSDLFLAYCITTHSAQGSEYDSVIVPVYDVEKMGKCLDRRWFYTAMTRARSRITIVSTPNIKLFVGRDLSPLPSSDLTIP